MRRRHERKHGCWLGWAPHAMGRAAVTPHIHHGVFEGRCIVRKLLQVDIHLGEAMAHAVDRLRGNSMQPHSRYPSAGLVAAPAECH